MINIFFVPGMFGSTVEYCLRKFSDKFTSTNLPDIDYAILDDGSVHTFSKEWHPVSAKSLCNDYSISTPIYPTVDGDFSVVYSNIATKLSDNIVIHADSLESAELALLFQYYKIANGRFNQGLSIFADQSSDNFSNWNPEYKNWKDLQRWEFREWYSLYYRYIADQFNPVVPSSALSVVNSNLLSNFVDEITKIFNHCDIAITNQAEFETFARNWTNAQQYIVDEFNQIAQYVNSAVACSKFEWTATKEINIISESVIQARLRRSGYEIKCDGLNVLPLAATDLSELLYKVDQ